MSYHAERYCMHCRAVLDNSGNCHHCGQSLDEIHAGLYSRIAKLNEQVAALTAERDEALAEKERLLEKLLLQGEALETAVSGDAYFKLETERDALRAELDREREDWRRARVYALLLTRIRKIHSRSLEDSGFLSEINTILAEEKEPSDG